MKNVLENIRRDIASGKTEKAIIKLLDIKNQFTQKERIQIEIIAGRYFQWKDKSIKGINDNDIELRKVENIILEIASGKKYNSKPANNWFFQNKVKTSIFSILLITGILLGNRFISSNKSVAGRDINTAGRDLTVNNIDKNEQIIHANLPQANNIIADKSIAAINKGTLIIIRDKSLGGRMLKDVLEINGGEVGKISAGDEKVIELVTGNYILNAKLSNGNYGNELSFTLLGQDTIEVQLSHSLLSIPKLELSE